MTPRDIRQRFLTCFFARLKRAQIGYCLLRNYDDLYGNATTDLDILVANSQVKDFEQNLAHAAGETDYRFVHSARYVNYSWVFWHPRAGFIRVDYETDVRWRVFTVLDAHEVLERCRPQEEYYIPHPEDEIVILYVAALWRGELSERYRRQLTRLREQCINPTSLRATLTRAFGPGGNALVDPAMDAAFVHRRAVTQLRRTLAIRGQILSPRCWQVGRNLGADLARLCSRLRQVAGASLWYVTSETTPPDFAPLLEEMEFLFPVKKHRLEILQEGPVGQFKRGFGWRLRRHQTLFKGGLFIAVCRVKTDADGSRLLRIMPPTSRPERSFICSVDQTGRQYFGHIDSGFMGSTADAVTDPQKASAAFVQFVCQVFERCGPQVRTRQPAQRGAVCALVGLDGAGKTTVARALCAQNNAAADFAGVRYFHWRPKIFRVTEWPLPDHCETPRKPQLSASVLNMILSVARIIRNGILARLAWIFHVRPLLRRGYLVIVDRYYYNYHLDPASVKCCAPPNWVRRLTRLFPAPDLVVKLVAPKDVLLARKGELTSLEVEAQRARLDALPTGFAPAVSIDATLAPDAVVSQIRSEILRTRLTN